MYKHIAQFDYRHKDSTSYIILGQRSSAMFDSGNDYVEISAPGKDMIQFQYTNTKRIDMVDYVESCYIIVQNYDGTETVSMMFELNEKNRPTSGIPTDYKFRYFVYIDAAPGEFDKVFESKESFKNSAKVEVIMALDDGSLQSEEIRAQSKVLSIQSKEIWYQTKSFWTSIQRNQGISRSLPAIEVKRI